MTGGHRLLDTVVAFFHAIATAQTHPSLHINLRPRRVTKRP